MREETKRGLFSAASADRMAEDAAGVEGVAAHFFSSVPRVSIVAARIRARIISSKGGRMRT